MSREHTDSSSEPRGKARTISAFQLIPMPTEQCNFRCSYCFEDFSRGRMSPEVVSGVKRLIERRAEGLGRLQIAWFGGEPLLAMDIVEDVQRYALELRNRYPGMELHGSMTTNGYLLSPELLTRLIRLGVREYQIAIDGPREQHDRSRVRAGGQPTFDRIWGNLEAAKRCDEEFAITIRLQIHRANRKSIATVIESFAETFGKDRRFHLAVVPLSCVGGAKADPSTFLDGQEWASTDELARQVAERQDLRTVESDDDGPHVCHAAHPDSLIVRSNGDLAKCAVALSHPKNRVGRLREDGQVEFDGPKLLPWLRGLTSGDEQELACPMLGLAEGPARG